MSQGFLAALYKNCVGNVDENYFKLFKNAQKNKLSVTQEFGTYAPMSVFKCLYDELMVFGNVESKDQYKLNAKFYDKLRKECRDTFYCENSVTWKRKILQSGIHLFDAFLNGKEDVSKVWNDDIMNFE